MKLLVGFGVFLDKGTLTSISIGPKSERGYFKYLIIAINFDQSQENIFRKTSAYPQLLILMYYPISYEIFSSGLMFGRF